MKSISMVVVAVLGLSAAEATPAPMGAATSPPPEPDQVVPPASPSDVTPLPAPGINGSVTEPAAPLPPGPPPIVYATPSAPPAGWRAPVGMAFLVGGGFQDFSNGTLRSMTGDGGYWTARGVLGTRQLIGFEAAYVGDARSISGLGLSSKARLMSNGLEGALRLNLPLARGPSLLEPFGFVGIGWAHYQVSGNDAATSAIATSDDIMTVPFGAGLELAYRGFMADARFTYRQTYDNNLLGTGGGNLNNWGMGGQIGFEY